MGKGWTHILCGLRMCLGRGPRRGTNLQACLEMEERVSFPAFGNLGQTCDLHDRQSKAGEARCWGPETKTTDLLFLDLATRQG